jgi:ABC-type transport system involved in multi-copper enzyme maturation permease subunit
MISVISSRPVTADAARSWSYYAEVGETFFYVLIGIELAMVMLAAPAATAGAICLDRSRGNLQHMMATDLSNAEIVFGKLAARMLPVLGLIGCSWPVMAICSLLGGIDPEALTMAFAVILAVAVLGCSMALTLSIWARRPHEVVLTVYSFWMVMLLAWPLRSGLSKVGLGAFSAWTFLLNPFMVAFARYSGSRPMGSNGYAVFLGGVIAISACLIAVAVWRVRAVSSLERVPSQRERRIGWIGRITRLLPGPSLDGNPVVWREWHRTRPSTWMLAMFLLIGGMTTLVCAMATIHVWLTGIRGPGASWEVAGLIAELIQIGFGLLMMAALAPLSMSEERQRGSLDLLAATTLSTREIVIGKWLGTFRLVPLLLVGPAIMSLGFATARPMTSLAAKVAVAVGTSRAVQDPVPTTSRLAIAVIILVTILAHGAFLTSLGLFLAIWVKRLSRAIAIGVCTFVFLAMGWPLIANSITGMNADATQLMLVSPLFSTLFLSEESAALRVIRPDLARWTLFWNAEFLVLAAGLLWWSVATFDSRFGRIPERERRWPVLGDVVVILNAIVAVAIAFGAYDVWMGAGKHSGSRQSARAELAVAEIAVLFIASGVVAALSVCRAERAGHNRGAALTRFFLIERWKSCYRLVLFAAIAPSLFGLTMAMPEPHWNVPARPTSAANGQATVRVSRPPEVSSTAATCWQAILADRLAKRAALLITILLAGAGITSLGIAAGVLIRSRLGMLRVSKEFGRRRP